jgi:ribosomal protein L37AE/L43A
MPPGDINNNNLINTDDTLTQETVATLLLQFESHRKSLRCPHCEKMGQFRRNGSTKTDPPMPIFRCHGCGKTFKARTMMYIVQSLVSSNSLVSSSNNETSGDFHNTQPTENSNTNDQAHYMQPLLDMIRRLSTELAATRAEIANLRQQVTQLQEQVTQQSMNMNQHTYHEDDNHLSSEDFPALPSQTPPWHNPQRISQIKRSLAEHEQQRRLQRQEAAARLLQSPSENQGFQYVYLPTKARVPIGQIRTRLRKLDITNNRILDIHYPDRNVVALLVHNDYVSELRKQLGRFKVTLKDDFDPCDPKVLRDPKYADLSSEERANFALMHHSDRMARALNYIRAPVKYAVARFFYSKGWISKTLLQEALPSRHKVSDQAADIFQSDDVTMDNADDLFHESINTDTNSTREAITIDDPASL